MSEIAIISGRTNQTLAKSIFDTLRYDFEKEDTKFIDTIIHDFANNEIFVKYKDSIRGKDVFIVQSFNSDPNKDLIEALLLADTAFAASAGRITLVLPTIYGSRQDRKSSPRTPVTISTVSRLIKSVQVDRVITVSLHSPQSSAAFFSAGLRFDNLSSANLFHHEMERMNEEKDFVIVSPDVGGLSKARYYAETIGCDLAFADKRRNDANHSEIINFVGDVRDRNCFIIDDMIDTGGSIVNVAKELKFFGAKDIYCLATHLILSKDAQERLIASPIKKIFGTDSVYHENLHEKFSVVSLSKLLGKVIMNINEDKSVGKDVEA